MKRVLTILFSTVLAGAAVPALASTDARLMRQPAVSAARIAFVYAGDIWVAPKAAASRSGSRRPRARSRSRASRRTARRIAFSGNYDGNDGHLRRADGAAGCRSGSPTTRRPTGCSTGTRTASRILFAIADDERQRPLQPALQALGRGRPAGEAAGALRRVRRDLPRRRRRWPTCRTARTSAPGSATAAAWAPDIWLFDLATHASKTSRTTPPTTASRCGTADALLPLRPRRQQARQHLGLRHRDRQDPPGDDVRRVRRALPVDRPLRHRVRERRPALPARPRKPRRPREVKIEVVTDRATLKPQVENVAKLIASADISPTGKRALFEARGDVFSASRPSTAPSSTSPARPGVAERFPAWSPDGKTVRLLDRPHRRVRARSCGPPTAPARSAR